MTRTIPLKIQNEYIVGDGVLIGAAGSHNDVVLRMAFGPMWDGLTKTVQFGDAQGESVVQVILTATMLEDTGTTSVYLVPVPSGAKEYAGKMTLAIKGAAADGEGTETRATLAACGEFEVAESKWDADADAEQDVTASQAVQLQQQIDTLLDDIQSVSANVDEVAALAEAAAESAETAAEEAQKAAGYAELSIGASVAVTAQNTTLFFTTKEGVGTYSGSYTVAAPVGEAQTLATAGKFMADDLTIESVSMEEVGNEAGGKTLTIGG